MINESLYSICERNEQVQQRLSQLDSYDSPCFVLVFSQSAQQRVCEALHFGASRAQIAIDELISLTKDTWLLVLDEAHPEVRILANEALGFVNDSGELIWIAVFRHNAIGNPMKTLRWNIQQLQSLMQDKQGISGLAINDFTDKRNWQGMEPYLSHKPATTADQEQATPCLESTKKHGWLRRILNVFSPSKKGAKPAHQDDYLNYGEKVLPFPLNQELIRLAPLIVHLPAGELLWQYVLTGEHATTIKEQGILLDLDHVLVGLHAKRHAVDFFDDICAKTGGSGFPEQGDIHDFLDRILAPLANELLTEDAYLTQKQDCYLRILDIFYHLFDQTPFNDDLYEQLVEDEDTAFLSDEAYQLRFGRVEQTGDDVSCEQVQLLRQVLDKLESVYWLDHRVLKQIQRLRKGARQVCDPTSWRLQSEPNEWLLAAILLHFDHQEGHVDQHSEALTTLVDEHLLSAIVDELSGAVKSGATLPDGISQWLSQVDVNDKTVKELASELGPRLELDSGAGADNQAQPRYELLRASSDFYLLLATCFWRNLAEPNELCQRVILLVLELDPQATLSFLVQFYSGKHAGFESAALAESFYLTLQPFNIEEQDLFAFKVRFAQQNDRAAYLGLMSTYFNFDESRQHRINQSLLRLRPINYQRFFADVQRLNPSFNFPTANEFVDIFREIHRLGQREDEAVIASYFRPEDVLYLDYLEYMPKDFYLPIKVSDATRMMPWPCQFAVLRVEQDHLELLVDSMNQPFDPETGDLHVLSVLILAEHVANEAVFSIINNLPMVTQRAETIEHLLLQYIKGEIGLKDFDHVAQHYIDPKIYGLDIEGYSRNLGHILPIILTEKDCEKRLRLISILASHPNRGRYVLADICFEIYLDNLLANGAITFDERREIELEDLNEQGQKELDRLIAATATQLANLNGVGVRVC